MKYSYFEWKWVSAVCIPLAFVLVEVQLGKAAPEINERIGIKCIRSHIIALLS